MALMILALGFVLRGELSEARGLPEDTEKPIDPDTATSNVIATDSRADGARASRRFELSRIDNDVLREFEKAWTISSNGTSGKEGVVLLFLESDGGYQARVQRKTNELRQVTFTWMPNAIAIVHTHPNKNDPKPSSNDMHLADRLKVPVITLTLQGMYVYDPATRKTTKVFYGLDWLDSSQWAKLAESKRGPDLAQH